MTDSNPKPDLAKREGALEFMDDTLAWAADCFRGSGDFTPMAFVLMTHDPKTGEDLPTPAVAAVSILGMGSAREKDNAVAMVRRLAKETRAVGVAMVMEVWGAHMTHEERAAWGDRSLADLPDDKRHECIWASLDHVALPHTAVWMAKITRDADGAPTLAPFEKQPEIVRTEGRFAETFPREQWQ